MVCANTRCVAISRGIGLTPSWRNLTTDGGAELHRAVRRRSLRVQPGCVTIENPRNGNAARWVTIAGWDSSARPEGSGTRQGRESLMASHIHEFPHPRLVLCYDHPPELDADNLAAFTRALDRGVACLELHLRWRAADHTIVCAHDDNQVTDQSPTFAQAMGLILDRKADKPTVYPDGKQFFVVLAIMDTDDPVTDHLFAVLQQYRAVLSTAVKPNDPPRPLTFLLTGGTDQFFAKYHGQGINELAIKEGTAYADGEIVNLSHPPIPFRWSLFHHDDDEERGKVNVCHRDQANVRIWYDSDDLGGDDIRAILATGADAQNTRYEDLDTTLTILHNQLPRGTSPALAARGSAAFVTWASGHKNLYAATGSLGNSELAFARQLNLTEFLSGAPSTFNPAAALAPDAQTLVIAYEGATGQGALWYVAGRFTSADRFITFAGGQSRLSSDDDSHRIGHNPAVALGPDGRVIVVYQTSTLDESLYYVSGHLTDDYQIDGQEYRLTNQNDAAVRGFTPSVAIDADNNVLVVYQGSDDEKLWYVSGSVSASGQIVDRREHQLTQGQARRGHRPSVAIRDDGLVAITYQGTTAPKLWYVTGRRDSSGEIQCSEFELSRTDPKTGALTRIGTRPTVAFGDANRGAILYEGTSDGKLWYVLGNWSQTGELVGEEVQLNMTLDKS
jgi:hypothetical protein